MLLRIDKHIFPTNIFILDYKVDFEIYIIWRKPFIPMGRALVDMQTGELRFRGKNEEVTLNFQRTMKQPTYMKVVSVIHYIDYPKGFSFGYLYKF